jgi:hypothetical protein
MVPTLNHPPLGIPPPEDGGGWQTAVQQLAAATVLGVFIIKYNGNCYKE